MCYKANVSALNQMSKNDIFTSLRWCPTTFNDDPSWLQCDAKACNSGGDCTNCNVINGKTCDYDACNAAFKIEKDKYPTLYIRAGSIPACVSCPPESFYPIQKPVQPPIPPFAEWLPHTRNYWTNVGKMNCPGFDLNSDDMILKANKMPLTCPGTLATGGTVFKLGTDMIHMFTSDFEYFIVKSASIPSLKLLIVGDTVDTQGTGVLETTIQNVSGSTFVGVNPNNTKLRAFGNSFEYWASSYGTTKNGKGATENWWFYNQHSVSPGYTGSLGGAGARGPSVDQYGGPGYVSDISGTSVEYGRGGNANVSVPKKGIIIVRYTVNG